VVCSTQFVEELEKLQVRRFRRPACVYVRTGNINVKQPEELQLCGGGGIMRFPSCLEVCRVDYIKLSPH
jgi:hypothetical protein